MTKIGSVTMSDVARVAGVTKMTVSYVLNGTGQISEKTRQKVAEAAQSLGYQPNPHAQILSSGRAHNTVGLFNLWFDLGVVTQKIQCIQSALNQHGYDVPVHGIGLHDVFEEEVQVAALSALRRQKPRGLVCFTRSLQPKALDELRRYQDEGGVLITYDYAVDLDCDRVVFDREDNTYQAARHLTELGHRDIVYADHGVAPLSEARLRGFQRALEEVGADWRPERILEGGEVHDYARAGHRLAQLFLELRPRPSAVCLVNDQAALVFITELERAGVRCPEDVSIIGHDDYAPSRYARVPLSSVTHPTEAIAHEVVQLLLSRLDGFAGPARQIAVGSEVIARQSSAPLALL